MDKYLPNLMLAIVESDVRLTLALYPQYHLQDLLIMSVCKSALALFVQLFLTSVYPRVVCQIKVQHTLPIPLSLRKYREHPALEMDVSHHREYEATTID